MCGYMQKCTKNLACQRHCNHWHTKFYIRISLQTCSLACYTFTVFIQGMDLVFERMYRSRDSSETVYKATAIECVHWHYWSMTEETAKLHCISYSLSDDWDDAHSCGLLVYHTDSTLIGYDS